MLSRQLAGNYFSSYLERMFIWCQKPLIVPPTFNEGEPPCLTSGMRQGVNDVLRVNAISGPEFTMVLKCTHLAGRVFGHSANDALNALHPDFELHRGTTLVADLSLK
jgi:hypothetical protein